MMKKIYTLAIVLLVLGVSSCKLGKHYSRPELRLPERRRIRVRNCRSVRSGFW